MDVRHSLFANSHDKKLPDIQPSNKSVTYEIKKLDGQALVYQNLLRVSSKHKSDKEKKLVHIKSGLISTLYPVAYVEGLTDEEIQISMPLRNAFGLTLGGNSNIGIIGVEHTKKVNAAKISCVIEKCFPNTNSERRLNVSEIRKKIIESLSDYPLIPGQVLIVNYENKCDMQLRIAAVNDISVSADIKDNMAAMTQLEANTEINISASKDSYVSLVADDKQNALSLDFASEGVGGHKQQLAQVLREGFYSRAMPAEYAKLYGVQHTKGILLYGPPGTGKTLIARVIGSKFTREKVKVVNGAELKNKFVGQSAENLRDVFADAWRDWRRYGDKSELHVIIFDEIDAMCPVRGVHHGGTGVDEDMVSQLLTLLDGVDSPQNVLIIGMTNRKDLIDSALLRPGRLEVHIEIGLPNQEDRLEILTIKTAKMSTAGLLDTNVNMQTWAQKTVNFTGAEIEQLVKRAVFFAMGNNFSDDDINKLVMKPEIKNPQQLAKVKQEHFERAFCDIKPAFGVDSSIARFSADEFAIYNDDIDSIVKDFIQNLKVMAANHRAHSLMYLISGEAGTGKTQLAMNLAYKTDAKFIKLLSADQLFTMDPKQQYAYIDDIFANLKRVEKSVLILDGLENLIGADAELTTYSNPLRLKFDAKLKELSQSDNKCVVIATTKSSKFIQRAGLGHIFNETAALSKVSLNKDNAINVLGRLCATMKIELKHDSDVPDGTLIKPIGELVYLIRKHMGVTGAEKLDVGEFMRAYVSPLALRAALNINLF